MAITVKKKLTVKTVKAKAPGEAPEAATSPEGAPVAAAVPAAPAAVPVAMPGGKPASYTLAGVLALISLLFFMALIALQYMEWDFYQGAFPVISTTPGMGTPVMPGETPTPLSTTPAGDLPSTTPATAPEGLMPANEVATP